MIEFKEQAACIGTDTEAWFTEEIYDKTGSHSYKNSALLKRICGGCPAKPECLKYALEHDVDGWWANTTDAQRKQMRIELNIIARPLYLDYEGARNGTMDTDSNRDDDSEVN